jgi:hypothetical protein
MIKGQVSPYIGLKPVHYTWLTYAVSSIQWKIWLPAGLVRLH